MLDLSSARQPPAVTVSAPLQLLPPATRHILRGPPAALAAAGNALGLSLSMPACRAAVHGALAALWLGPDERLLLAEQVPAAEIERRLASVLRDQPHSLVDITHRQVALGITGAHAASVLAAGCPLDLDLAAFPVGMCTRTVLAKAEIVLWRRTDDGFHLEVWRSFAAYVSAVIAEAAHELTGSV